MQDILPEAFVVVTQSHQVNTGIIHEMRTQLLFQHTFQFINCLSIVLFMLNNLMLVSLLNER